MSADLSGGPSLDSQLVCAGCGAALPPDAPHPFRCPAAESEGDADHVLVEVADLSGAELPLEGDPEPFVRFRHLLHGYRLARRAGMDDETWIALAQRLDEAVAEVDGRGFRVTPLRSSDALDQAVGARVLVKDETGQVGGSHKARHLMGLALHLEAVEALGLAPAGAPLAIASCGNAALGAAVVARAAGRRLAVFIPPDAEPVVVRRLAALGAEIHVCHREGTLAGDPCYHAFRRAVAEGALPFCCQGPDNGLTISGGRTLGWELAADLARAGRRLDDLYIQVGGGALASATIQALRMAVRLGAIEALPRIHTVQTRGGHPLGRAWERLRAELGADQATPDRVATLLADAACRRSEFMWPWEDEPHSIAHGILDDETYDWLEVARGMLETGGQALVVGEDVLVEAHDLAADTCGIAASHTGAAGLAGLLAHVRSDPAMAGRTAAVLLTGVER